MYYHHQNDKIVILILYIDDLFMIWDDVECISWLEKELGNKLDMTSIGQCSKYLGIQFVH
jgi:DNA helicase TIP49 (TBP-interacting protein)